MNEILAKRLVMARENAGYTRKALCEELRIPYRTITNYENGSREPGSEYLIRIANLCGCTIDWLLGLPGSAYEDSRTVDPVMLELDKCIRRLNDAGREKLLECAADLTLIEKYVKDSLVSNVEASYIKSRSDSAPNTGSAASNTTEGTGNEAANQ